MVLNGTTYKASPALAEVIERCRQSKKRFRFYLGDSTTGRAWGDVDKGYLGRSMGPVKIPIVLANRRSLAGPGLLDQCVVKIEFANKTDGGVVYQHPTYTPTAVRRKSN
jgi:hypothetical protein